MFSISNEELIKASEIGETIICPYCNNKHKIEYGEKVLPDGSRVTSKIIAFYRCGDKIYLAAVNGKNVIKY